VTAPQTTSAKEAPHAAHGSDAGTIATTPGASLRSVLRQANGVSEAVVDAIAAEVPVAFAFNDAPFAVMMATPEDLEDFAIGFPVAEGLVRSAREVHIERIQVHLDGASIALRIPEDAMQRIASRRRAMEGRSGCGICGSESIEAVLAPPPRVPAGTAIGAAALAAALQALHGQQPLNARTGATHAAAFVAADGSLQLVREDVGRHNALDKLIGTMARGGHDPASGFALVTSRASYEMVMKSARAGFPLLAAISAPTALAVALADHAGMTLVGFARAQGHVVYTHPKRLLAADPAT
jgi:FdhD protein